MTTNKPNVKRYNDMGLRQICPVHNMYESDNGDYVLYEDYKALQAECEKLRIALDAHKAARIAYASEFPLGANGTPDVGSIHENIRLLKKDAERYRCIREGNHWIVAATQTGVHLDGKDLDDLIDGEIADAMLNANKGES